MIPRGDLDTTFRTLHHMGNTLRGREEVLLLRRARDIVATEMALLHPLAPVADEKSA